MKTNNIRDNNINIKKKVSKMKVYIYIKSVPDDGLKILYNQAKKYDSNQPKNEKLNIPSDEYPELRSFVQKSYYLENDEKFCSPVDRDVLVTDITDEIVRRFIEE